METTTTKRPPNRTISIRLVFHCPRCRHTVRMDGERHQHLTTVGRRPFQREAYMTSHETLAGGGQAILGCVGCRCLIYGQAIHGHTNPAVPCSAKCTGATGNTCECSCGGKNHAAGHAVGGVA